MMYGDNRNYIIRYQVNNPVIFVNQFSNMLIVKFRNHSALLGKY